MSDMSLQDLPGSDFICPYAVIILYRDNKHTINGIHKPEIVLFHSHILLSTNLFFD